MPAHIAVAADGYYHPENEAQLVELVRHAYTEKLQLRVRGSRHTFPAAAIDTDRGPGDARQLSVQLDRYRQVEWLDREQGIVRVQGGCQLSRDPHDPLSNDENGLLHVLDRAGFTLETLGGITHQTIAGFLATGSAGGTTKWHFGDALLELRLIDGTGTVRLFSREIDLERFCAAGVSLGLLGVISSVTLRAVPKFDIEGSEATTSYEDCAIDLFGAGDARRESLEQWLRRVDYGRVLWWPQPGVERVAVWQARRASHRSDLPSQPTASLLEEAGISPALGPVLLALLGNAESLGGVPAKLAPLSDFLDESLAVDLAKLGLSETTNALLTPILNALARRSELPPRLAAELNQLLPELYAAFVPLDCHVRGGEPQTFRDAAFRALPMDNASDDRFYPSWFSELWLPLSATREMMNRLKQHFEQNGISASGNYAFEVYASKRNEFWLSPSYGDEDRVRFDIFWYARNAGEAGAFFGQFWDLLKPFGCRAHWGKHLPPRSFRELTQSYPRLEEFLRLRAELDPSNIFLTRYWREQLGVESA